MRSHNIFYTYPHPAGETFGPAAAIFDQERDGHEVYLLTLTRGGATRDRCEPDVNIDEMGEIGFKEMLKIKDTLKPHAMLVPDPSAVKLKDGLK